MEDSEKFESTSANTSQYATVPLKSRTSTNKVDDTGVNISAVEFVPNDAPRLINTGREGTERTLKQVTTFVDDCETDPTRASVRGVLAAPSAIDEWDHSIKAVLGRPVIVHTGTWGMTSFRGVELARFNVADEFFKVNKNASAKLERFSFFRAEVHVRVLLNVTQFQQGAIGIFLVPMPEELSNATLDLQLMRQGQTSIAAMYHRTGLPFYTQLVVNSGTDVELVIPYCNPCMWGTLTDNKTRQGTIVLQVQNGLTVNDATFTVYCWLEKVEVHMPTAVKNVPQFTAGQVLAQLKVDNPELFPNDRSDAVSGTSETITRIPSAKNRGGVLPPIQQGLEVEVPKKKINYERNGLIDQGIHVAHTAIDVFASAVGIVRDIPILGSLMTAFGLSNPRVSNETANFVQKPMMGIMQSHKKVNSSCLAPRNDMQVQIRNDITPFKEDMMNIRNICVRPRLLLTKSWSDTTVAGHVVVILGVTPIAISGERHSHIRHQTNGNATIKVSPVTHAYYLANVNAMWRGATRFRFDVIKTNFHSGRLLICFWPNDFTVRTTVSHEDAANVYNIVLDLKESSTITVELPFVSRTYYKNCGTRNIPNIGVLAQTIGTTAHAYDETNSIGSLTVSVLNVLRRPTTANASVDINVWVSTGDDFELVMPNVMALVPQLLGSSTTPFPVSRPVIRPRPDVHQQGFETTSDLTSSMPLRPTKMYSTQLGPRDSAITYGNPYTSIAQYIKRQMPVFAPDFERIGSDYGQIDDFISVLSFNPWCFRELNLLTWGETGTSPVVAPSRQSMPYLTYFSLMYVGFRGGLELSIFSPGPQKADSTAPKTRSPREDETITVSSGWFNNNEVRFDRFNKTDSAFGGQYINPHVFEMIPIRQGFVTQVSIPYISSTTFTTMNYQNNVLTNSLSKLPNYLAGISISCRDIMDKEILIGAADDFRFEYFLGAPVVLSLDPS